MQRNGGFMMKCKKLFAILLILAFTMMLFSACNSNSTPDTTQQTPSNAQASEPIKTESNAPEDTSSPEKSPTEKKTPNGETEPSNNEPAAPTLSSDSNGFSQISSLDNTKKEWGPGGPVDENNRSQGAISYQEKYGKYDADFIAPNSKKIYLTFDEGYENGYTAAILDVLKEKKCPAVFFVTMPYAKGNPELIQRMIDEGHVVGNHSVNHLIMPEISLEKQAAEIKDLHQYIKDKFHYDMTLFRYPTGAFSERSLALVQKLGYRSVFWSYAYKDWVVDQQPDPAEALQTLHNKMHPGAIYLLHAVSKTNTDILGDFIDNTRAAGYQFSRYDL